MVTCPHALRQSVTTAGACDGELFTSADKKQRERQRQRERKEREREIGRDWTSFPKGQPLVTCFL
jgi:hypothetical protein